MKRNEEETKKRLDKILEADKEEMSAASRRAAEKDFEKVAKEYFETEGKISLKTQQIHGMLEVNVSFRASRVKNFYSLK